MEGHKNPNPSKFYCDYFEELDPAAYKNLLLTITREVKEARLTQKNYSFACGANSFDYITEYFQRLCCLRFSGNQKLQAQFQKLWSMNNGAERILDNALAALGKAKRISKTKKN